MNSQRFILSYNIFWFCTILATTNITIVITIQKCYPGYTRHTGLVTCTHYLGFAFINSVMYGIGEFLYLAVLDGTEVYALLFFFLLMFTFFAAAGWNHLLNLACFALLTANLAVILASCTVGLSKLAAHSVF